MNDLRHFREHQRAERKELRDRQRREMNTLRERQHKEYQQFKAANMANAYGMTSKAAKRAGIDLQLPQSFIDEDNKYMHQIKTYRNKMVLGNKAFITADYGDQEARVMIHNIGDDSAPKCECGIHKIHGNNTSPRMHSTWCPLHGDS